MIHKFSLLTILMPALAFGVSAGFVQAAEAPSRVEADGGQTGLAPWDGPRTPEILQIAAHLRASRTGGTNEHRILLERISETVAHDLDSALEILIRMRVPETNAEDAPQILSEPQLRLVLSALARLPVADVRKRVDARLESDSSTGMRRAAMQALGAVGRAGELKRLLEIAPREEDGSLDRSTRAVLRTAACSIYARDDQAIRDLPDTLGKVTPEAGEELLFALGARRDNRVLAVLADVAQRFPAHAPLCVSRVHSVGPAADAQVDLQFCAWMVDQLPMARSEYQAMLLQALGELDDGASLEVLVEHLSSSVISVRDAAALALKRITGLAYAPEASAWESYLAESRSWMREERPRLQQSVLKGKAERAADALRQLGNRKLHRNVIVDDVAAALERPEVEIRRLACETLARLGSRAALAPLCDALEDADLKVSQSAWNALTTLAGFEPPRSRQEARTALGLL
ncbi:MAG: hypothetical protein JNL28_06215 [Planctomycetes bacterium]|nr:hypothetical protein [Planctomycetota bacterium]